jgi:hypothetical protein
VSRLAEPVLVARADSEGALASDSLTAASTARSGPPLLRGDRLQHASLSFTLAAGLTVLFRDRAAGAGVALGLGIAKELWDSRHGGADATDLLADALGVGAALLTVRAGTGADP